MAFTDTLRSRMRTIRTAFVATRRADPKMLPLVVGSSLLALVVFVGLGVLVGAPVLGTVMGILLALLVATAVFGRRASRAQFEALRGQPGAAASVLQSMRGQWIVAPAVAYTRKQDLVHRVVGRCGVVLVGEGGPSRTRGLLKQEQRKVGRVVGETPVHVLMVGDGPDDVPLDKLRNKLMRLPRKLKKREVAAVNKRLASLPSGDLPIPKGPMPGNVKPPRPRSR